MVINTKIINICNGNTRNNIHNNNDNSNNNRNNNDYYNNYFNNNMNTKNINNSMKYTSNRDYQATIRYINKDTILI